MRHTAEDTRRSSRYTTMLKGLYCLDEKNGEGKESSICTIINISYDATGFKVCTFESLSVNSKIFLEIFPPDGQEAINVEGIIQRVKQGKEDCVCGMKLTEKLNATKKTMLRV